MCFQYSHEPTSVSTANNGIQCIDIDLKAKLVVKTKGNPSSSHRASICQDSSENRPNKLHRRFEQNTTSSTIPVPGFVLYRRSPPRSARRGTKAEENKSDERGFEDAPSPFNEFMPISRQSWIAIYQHVTSKLKKEEKPDKPVENSSGGTDPDNALGRIDTIIFPSRSSSLPGHTELISTSNEEKTSKEPKSPTEDTCSVEERPPNLSINSHEPAEANPTRSDVADFKRDEKAQPASESGTDLPAEIQPVVRDFAYKDTSQQSSDPEYFSATEGHSQAHGEEDTPSESQSEEASSSQEHALRSSEEHESVVKI